MTTQNIVLVHGGFVDGSGWRGVYDILKRDGYNVTIVQNPTTSLAADVAATRSAIAAQDGPIVLVGHSYGGVVISEAGTDPKVERLVYIAAFAPDDGESVQTLIADPPAGAPVPPILPPQDGFLFLDRDKFAASFAADVEAETPPSWPTRRCPGAWTPSPAPSPSRPGGTAELVSRRHRRPHDPARRPAPDGEPGRRDRRRDPRQPRDLCVAVRLWSPSSRRRGVAARRFGIRLARRMEGRPAQRGAPRPRASLARARAASAAWPANPYSLWSATCDTHKSRPGVGVPRRWNAD